MLALYFNNLLVWFFSQSYNLQLAFKILKKIKIEKEFYPPLSHLPSKSKIKFKKQRLSGE